MRFAIAPWAIGKGLDGRCELVVMVAFGAEPGVEPSIALRAREASGRG